MNDAEHPQPVDADMDRIALMHVRDQIARDLADITSSQESIAFKYGMALAALEAALRTIDVWTEDDK